MVYQISSRGHAPASAAGPRAAPDQWSTVITVAAIDFEERDLEARVPDLAAGGTWTRVRLRWRRDPLTGVSARILTGVKLQPDRRADLTERTTRPDRTS